jgi:dimethylhistidine N-methyltransferase
MAIHGNTISRELRAGDEGAGNTTEHIHTDIKLSPLAEEVRTGLAKSPKRLSSRFFYDGEGSRIFQEIMQAPEYYLTRSEYEILDTYKAELLRLFMPDKMPFDLVELGAGDGLKTKLLLEFFYGQTAPFTYAPVDISADALDGLVADVRQSWPELPLNPQHNDYFKALEHLSIQSDHRRVVMFLGSNIGNFTPDEAVDFYQQLHDRLQPGDLILTGFDLQKHPAIIHAAYNDQQGLTKAFNLNLLRRINDELDADFELSAFSHYEVYNPENGEARSYLVSEKAQTVQVDALSMTVSFDKGEIIHTEISRKFTRTQIEQLAEQTGFRIAGWFTDPQGYFVDVVYQRV